MKSGKVLGKASLNMQSKIIELNVSQLNKILFKFFYKSLPHTSNFNVFKLF